MNVAIHSIGAPPERHADRVVAKLLRHLSTVTAGLLPNINAVVEGSSDGSPRAQRKLEARLKQKGAIGTILKPGKRGRYEIRFFLWTGWDPARGATIELDDPIPPKPWLSCNVYTLRSAGRGLGLVQLFVDPMLFFTHHALSRLAQRHGAKTSDDLVNAVMDAWAATMELAKKEGFDRLFKPSPAGWRVRTETGGTVVLKRYERFNALIATTII